MQHMKNYQAVISQWLEKIGEDRGIPLKLGANGHCIVPMSEDFGCVVEVTENQDLSAVFLYCPLAQLPNNADAQLALTSAALAMNLFGLLTGGCHVGLDNRSNHLVLSFSAPIEAINSSTFEQILTEMEEISSDLRQRLQGIVTPPSFVAEPYINWHHHNRMVTPSATTDNVLT